MPCLTGSATSSPCGVRSADGAGLVRPGTLSRATSLHGGRTATSTFCDYTLGRWNVACSSATEVRMLVTETSAPAVLADALHLVADMDAARGRACREACAELRTLADAVDDPGR